MSLKSIELQIAIPKTFDAGKQVEQAQQNVHGNQAMANDALKKQLEKNHTLLLHSEETRNLRREDPQSNGQLAQQQQQEQSSHLNEGESNEKTVHPFKGNLFDFSG